jgi:plasmid stabilization system protein ParE
VGAILERAPEAFPDGSGRRRALVRRFPYQVIYRVEEDAVVVLACFHHRRDPEAYRSRR